MPDTADRAAARGPSRRLTLQALAGFAGTAAMPGAGAAQQLAAPVDAARRGAAQPAAPQPLEIAAREIVGFERTEVSRRRFGRLEFRGGLVLASPLKDFGGWSGLILDDEGRRVLAVSDRGHWLSAEIAYAAGRPAALRNAVIGEIAGIGGRPLRGRDADAESIALLGGTLSRGTALIAFERNHRIGRFQIGPRGLEPASAYLKMPAGLQRAVGFNKGIEAVGVIRGGVLAGSIVAFAEEGFDQSRNHTGWLWPGGVAGEPVRLGLTNIGDYAITDIAMLPDGNMIVLERKFRWLEGVRMRLRLVPAAAIRPEALLEGEMLIEAGVGHEIDNMEGLAVSRAVDGRPLLTLLSDDNFNGYLQRTILLQFALVA